MERFLYHFFLCLARIFDSRERRGNSLHIVFMGPNFSIKGNKIMTTLALNKVFYFGLTLDADANGLPTTLLPAAPVWTVSDATKASVVPSSDGTSVQLTTLAAGDFTLSVTSDTLADSVSITVEAPVAGVTTGIHIVQLADAPAA